MSQIYFRRIIHWRRIQLIEIINDLWRRGRKPYVCFLNRIESNEVHWLILKMLWNFSGVSCYTFSILLVFDVSKHHKFYLHIKGNDLWGIKGLSVICRKWFFSRLLFTLMRWRGRVSLGDKKKLKLNYFENVALW